MNTLYLDCFSGIAGDMLLAALFDLAMHRGVSDTVNPQTLEQALSTLKLPKWSLELKQSQKRGIQGLQVSVMTPWGEERVEDPHHDHPHHDHPHHAHPHHPHHDHPHHSHDDPHHEAHEHGLKLKDILKMIDDSELNDGVKERASKVFKRLGDAEAQSHGVPWKDVHFHEVGMIDSIVDIVGVAWCLDKIEVKRIISAPLPINRGWVKCAHGLMPLPAPATARLLIGLPTIPSDERVELVTPTGAAMIAAWANEVTDRLPNEPIKAIGIGAGKRDLPNRPNLLRVFLYEDHHETCGDDRNSPPLECWRIETNLDDMTPEHLAFMCKKLFEMGALDVWTTPIIMKKGRSAITLSALCDLETRSTIEHTLLRHSTAIGLRSDRVFRSVLPRRLMAIETRWGELDVKVSKLERREGGTEWKVKPEFDHIERISEVHQVPIAHLHSEAVSLAKALLEREGDSLWSTLKDER